ncbi:hypothetical protein OEZ86_003404 [Tetradesmus obliquus]|uniref:Uncharacterized protein n=1 Tax=Tetradesmus obliquus TaxID=3088 RepID=A0ABY8TVL0_TETOB|nr:hypothetical protein OEZ85_012479 [Tetradesmus obliquus]WIA32601.1 hypothetical protein OEZ86_003404 [Tetradesmus obliquus]
MLGQRQAAVRTGSPLLQKVSRTPVVLKRRSGVLQVQCNAAAASWQASAIAAVQQQPVFQLAASVIGACQQFINVARDKFSQAFPQLQNVDKQEAKQQLMLLYRNMRAMAFLVLPLARVSQESLSAVYARTFEKAAFGFAKMYVFCLFMRVLLSWFPGIDWNAQPWTFLRLITEPYLQIYRGILPPLFGQLDFTPLFGFLILQDIVEVMAPTYTMGLHDVDTSTRWTTSDVMCYFDGF